LRLFKKKIIKKSLFFFRDFNPEEGVSDKLRRIPEIKDGRGLRKFVKETLSASAGRITHELIGSVEIPIRVRFL